MPRKQHCYHYLYKTTNLINEKYYYGMHSTSNLDDNYLGSGDRLRHAIRKYGKENFKREILEMFDSREELVQGEIELITEDLLNDPMCMNIKPGGSGGFVNEQHRYNFTHSTGPLVFALKLKTDEELKRKHFLIHSPRMKKAYAEGKFRYDTFTGKTHTEDTKKKMSESSKGMCTGEKNGSFGTCWITRDNENKKIKRDELESFILQGWSKGRKLK
jgi:hypothetical protein